MAIPAFDPYGNLSLGRLFRRGGVRRSLVPASLPDIHGRFVAGKSAQRARIWAGWMRHRKALDEIMVPYHTLVDGSFITTKAEPDDVDLCLLFEGRVANALPPSEQAKLQDLLDQKNTKRTFGCDVYGVAVHEFSNRWFLQSIRYLTYWTRVFGVDRLGRQKAFLVVPGGGTP